MPNAMRTMSAFCGDVLGSSLQHLKRERVPEAAATIAFYTIFSLFPVLLILAAIGGSLVETLQAEEEILDIIVNAFPIERELIRSNVTRLVNSRGAVGLVGILTLLWAATSAFDALVRNINRAWVGSVQRGILKTRLTALAVVGGLVGLLAVFLLARAAIGVVTKQVPTPAADTFVSALHGIPSNLIFFVVVFLILLALYRLVPSTRVRWLEAAGGAGVASGAFVAATGVFSWYLGSGFARYNVVYGSLGALLAFLSWVYIVSMITLGGAHVSAAIAACVRAGDTHLPQEPEKVGGDDATKGSDQSAETADASGGIERSPH
ncbi:MAG: YihY family inner membrane protein [Candidatus Eisenbacteria bacterium]|nr:YihY family inner membrane protein [Candidatus Eisenbacteria bacterium]